MDQLVATPLARHESLSVIDFRCTTRVENIHTELSVSYVREGSLRYRARGQTFDLVPGAILIGRPGVDYLCTHEGRDGGGACLSFRLGPGLADMIGARAVGWTAFVPPIAELMVLGELAQAAVNGTTDVGLDELGFLLICSVRKTLADADSHFARGTAVDRKRAIELAAWIDEHCNEHIDLDTTAKLAGTGPFHLLRTFSKVLGVTPHQYLIRCRLRRAARHLVENARSITEIALDVGFADLSNFVRTFRRASGLSPQRFRQAVRNSGSGVVERLLERRWFGAHSIDPANDTIGSIFSKPGA